MEASGQIQSPAALPPGKKNVNENIKHKVEILNILKKKKCF
jgi:hypothetical protein